MNIGFDDDEKTLCIFDDVNGGILIAELGTFSNFYFIFAPHNDANTKKETL